MPARPGLAGAGPADARAGRRRPVDEATAHAEPDERADRVRRFVGAAGGLETAGYCRTSYRSAAFANSAGQSA